MNQTTANKTRKTWLRHALVGTCAGVLLLAGCSSNDTAQNATTTRPGVSKTNPGTAPGTTKAKKKATDEQSTGTVADGSEHTGPTVEDTDGSSIPIVLASLASGYQKPTVNVSVGGGPAVPVLLDTGSTGLHILATSVGTTNVTNLGTPLTESFADGSQYIGTMATAPVTIGGVATTGNIDLMLINTVGCTSTSSNCPSPSAQAMITNNGVYGTMGVSLAPSSGCGAALYSPLLQVPGGTSGYSINFGNSGTGTIVLGNTPPVGGGQSLAIDSSTFTTVASGSNGNCAATSSSSQYPNGAGAWDTSTAQLCWSVSGATPVCGRTTFDTGSENAGIAIGSFPGAPTTGNIVTAGTTVTLSGSSGGPALWTLTTGTQAGKNRLSTSSPASYLTGTTGGEFYFNGWVTYDAQNGAVVVTPLTGAAAGAGGNV